MRIDQVTPDNRRHRFDITTRRGEFSFPYERCEPKPTSRDRLVEVFVDSELGRQAFTYRLKSGAEGSVHLDTVLDQNADPAYLAELEMYKLTIAAKERLQASGFSVRAAAERLGTSPAQLYRVLDPTNYQKSARQLLAVLALGGAAVAVSDARPRETVAARKTPARKAVRRKAPLRAVGRPKVPA